MQITSGLKINLSMPDLLCWEILINSVITKTGQKDC